MSQTGKHVAVYYQVEATLNTAPGASTSEQLRITPSAGLKLVKEAIRSNEVRSDGLTTMARHGSRRVEGAFGGELSVGSFDTVLQAVMRSTAVTAVAVTAATASIGSITTTSNEVVAAGTGAQDGWIDAGLKVGDVFRITGQNASNNNLNLRVAAVATNTLRVLGSAVLTVDASAETGFTVTVGKKLKNGTSPTRRSFYVDQYDEDIDLSEVFGGVRFTGFRLRGAPDGMADIEVSALGMSATALASGASPYYTNPTTYTSDPLVFADAVISLGGTDIAIATAFELNCEINADTLPVIGSSITPNVYDNDLTVTGSLTLAREDLSRLSNFTDEDELELHILLQENEDAPKDYISVFVPRLKFMDLDTQLGNDGAKTETVPWEAGLKATATGYDQTMLTILTSAS